MPASTDAEVPYTPNVEREGRYSQAVRMDFLVEGLRLGALSALAAKGLGVEG